MPSEAASQQMNRIAPNVTKGSLSPEVLRLPGQ
jgi:hypothetical protein